VRLRNHRIGHECESDYGPCQICEAVAKVDEEISQAVVALRRLISKRCDGAKPRSWDSHTPTPSGNSKTTYSNSFYLHGTNGVNCLTMKRYVVVFGFCLQGAARYRLVKPVTVVDNTRSAWTIHIVWCIEPNQFCKVLDPALSVLASSNRSS